MEMSVQDWVILVGVILILAILLDGYRRMRSDRGEKIRVSLVRVPGDEADPDDILSAHELPTGGARVVDRSDLIPDQLELHHEEDEQAPLLTGMSADRRDPIDQVLDGQTEEASDVDITEELPSVSEPEPPAHQDVLMIHVVANQQDGFAGHDILQILLACDLRFGQSSFFHRHEGANGRGEIQFSVANMVTPGQFAIDEMDGFSTPGLTFFVVLPGPSDMMQAFDYMLETAQCVADNLDGSLLDETRSGLSPQITEHCRERIRDLERKMLAQR